ncbi:MAG: hypothetical protein EBQ92_00480, partial [Proteobacteria bacterium]|nr:hypothetical protein [Pseudomonadota bacterium]
MNVKDPEGILKRVGELQALAGRYKTFYTDPEIMAELSGVSPEQAAAEMAPPPPAQATEQVNESLDPAEAQRIKNSIAEGEMILKSGRSISGRKMSDAELQAVQRSVDNARAKLSTLPSGSTAGGDLFGGQGMPFNLSGQVDTSATPAELAEAERIRQEKAAADAAQGDMFSGGFSGTADYGPQGGSSAKEAGPSIPKEATVMSRGPGWEMPEVLGATDRVLPIEAPELIRWFREATGMSPEVRRRMKSLGLFTGIGKGRIAIRASLFSNPQSVAMTLAHELGHWIDYLPDESLKRGNILGRLATLSRFKSNFLPEIEGSNKEIRAELIALSDWWKPFGAETANKKSSYYKYRVSAVELYADAISVLFNSPADLEARAPKFWKAFFDLVDRKPDVAEAITAIQT